MGLEITFSIISVLSLIICLAIMIDRTLFMSKIRDVRSGMTGKQIQNLTGLKIKVIKVDGTVYYAIVSSYMTIFRYRLVFCNGKLINKQRD